MQESDPGLNGPVLPINSLVSYTYGGEQQRCKREEKQEVRAKTKEQKKKKRGQDKTQEDRTRTRGPHKTRGPGEKQEDMTKTRGQGKKTVPYTHLRAHETSLHVVCRLLSVKINEQLPPHDTYPPLQAKQPHPRSRNFIIRLLLLEELLGHASEAEINTIWLKSLILVSQELENS